MEKENYYKTRLRAKGQITLPTEIREKLGIREGDDVAFYTNEKGQVVVDRLQVIPPDQAWFWTERWQKMEREVDEDIAAGRILEFDSVEQAIKYLNNAAEEYESDQRELNDAED
jgi:AbrB family looped-hinge helix DNA binding protein